MKLSRNLNAKKKVTLCNIFYVFIYSLFLFNFLRVREKTHVTLVFRLLRIKCVQHIQAC